MKHKMRMSIFKNTTSGVDCCWKAQTGVVFPGLNLRPDGQMKPQPSIETHSMMGAERSLVMVFLSRTWAKGLGLQGRRDELDVADG